MAADRLAQTLTEMHALFESALSLKDFSEVQAKIESAEFKRQMEIFDRSVCCRSADRHTLPMKGVF
jgi:hypothetical protein